MRIFSSLLTLLRVLPSYSRINTRLYATTMPKTSRYADFFACEMFLVVGASEDRSKFGNKVLRCYKQKGRYAVPVNKRVSVIEDLPVVESLTQFRNVLNHQVEVKCQSHDSSNCRTI
jgi:hypothetical protein